MPYSSVLGGMIVAAVDCSHGDLPSTGNRPSYGRIAQLALLGIGIGMLVLVRSRQEFRTFGINFVAIVLEAFPFMLLGTLIGGFIEVLVPRERIAAILPRRRWVTVFLAAGVGLIFPVCECAIVPVVRRLLRKGVPFGAAIAFLLGGPIVNPVVGASTAVAYSGQWAIVAARLGCGYVIAVIAGLLMNILFTRETGSVSQDDENAEHCSCGHDHQHHHHHEHAHEPHAHAGPSRWQRVAAAFRHAAQDFFDIARYLIMGAFIAAILQTVISREGIGSLVTVPILAILLMMVLAIALNLCSEADAFVAASFRSSGLPLSAQLAFMVLGPMLDVKLVLMYLGVFRRRAIVALCSLTFTLVLVAMLILEYCRR